MPRASNSPHAPGALRPAFRIVGMVDGALVRATRRGHLTLIDPTLLREAQRLVSGAAFVGDGSSARRATLRGEPATVLATLIRACDEVLECTFDAESLGVRFHR